MRGTGTFRFGEVEVNGAQRRLRRGGEEIELQPKVFETLLYLVARSDRVVPKEELLEAIWPDTFVTENALSRCVRQIRLALQDDARSPRFLRTVPRVGYQFVADVEGSETPQPAAARSIAVLPFRSLAAEVDQGLELGMADTLVTRLSRAQLLVVRPLSATQDYSPTEETPLELAARLSADLVVDGSIQRAAERLRVTARLTRVGDGQTLWAEQLDRPEAEVFAIQDAICSQIIAALEVALTRRERLQMTKRPTASSEAYESYLLGRLHFSRHTSADVERSLEYFERAIDLDPAYSLAWTGLAEAYDVLGTQGIKPMDYSERTRRAATRARALDGELGDPLRCLAKIAWQHDWEWDAADRLFREAMELDPNSSETMIAYSDYCCYMRRAEEAEALARAALAIDPVSAWVNALLVQALHIQRKHREAVAQAEHTLEIAPGFPFALFFGGLGALVLGRSEKALGFLEEAVDTSGRLDFVGPLGCAYARVNQPDRARQLLEELDGNDAVPPITYATLHMALGDLDRAFEQLELCFRQRSWHALLPYSEPLFDPLRADPRAADLFRRLGLATT
jgi:serine/threonine-protein kinase